MLTLLLVSAAANEQRLPAGHANGLPKFVDSIGSLVAVRWVW
jgi:hypothetical protein